MSGGLGEGESSELMPEASQGQIAGKFPILSLMTMPTTRLETCPTRTDAADRPGQGDGVGQSLPGSGDATKIAKQNQFEIGAKPSIALI